MNLLLVDNYDSFTYNIVHAFAKIGCKATVERNDQITVNECVAMRPSHLVIGPGPGSPKTAGISLDLIKAFAGKIPILGICLGHQCIAEAFGGTSIRALTPIHGKSSLIYHTGEGVFKGLKDPFFATRYHSLITCPKSLPKALKVTAKTDKGEVMGLEHKALPINGVQFHPDSILSEECEPLLRNFLKTPLQNRDALPPH